MSIHSQIEEKLTAQLEPLYLEVINESHQHSGPAKESHFKVVAVSERFVSQSRIQRHRELNALLSEELQAGVHALSLKLYTRQEWEQAHGEVPPSPPCLGGSKRAARSQA